MATKVYNISGGMYSGSAFSAFENTQYGTCVANDASFKCTAGSGMNINIAAGDCIISYGETLGVRAGSTSVETTAVPAAPTVSGQSRYDAVVAYINMSIAPTQENVDNTDAGILSFMCVAGVAATSPTKSAVDAKIQSAIGSGNPYIVLAYIKVPANTTSTSAMTIEDARKVAGLRVTLSTIDIAPGSNLAPGMIYGVYK